MVHCYRCSISLRSDPFGVFSEEGADALRVARREGLPSVNYDLFGLFLHRVPLVGAGGTVSKKYEDSSPFSDASIVLLCAKMVSVTPHRLLTAAAKRGRELGGQEMKAFSGQSGLRVFVVETIKVPPKPAPKPEPPRKK
jgi:hypothetical protein